MKKEIKNNVKNLRKIKTKTQKLYNYESNIII